MQPDLDIICNIRVEMLWNQFLCNAVSVSRAFLCKERPLCTLVTRFYFPRWFTFGIYVSPKFI